MIEKERQIYLKHIKKALDEVLYSTKELRLIQNVVFNLLPPKEEVSRGLELMNELFENDFKTSIEEQYEKEFLKEV